MSRNYRSVFQKEWGKLDVDIWLRHHVPKTKKVLNNIEKILIALGILQCYNLLRPLPNIFTSSSLRILPEEFLGNESIKNKYLGLL